MVMVETHDLTKVFNGRKAVNRLTLTIEEGELFGLLGPGGLWWSKEMIPA
jgi:ABC-type multidrug transport system ATPase subunit